MIRIAIVVALAAVVVSMGGSATAPAKKRATEVLRFDVAEDATRFSFAPSPVDADGQPAYGNAFVTQGYIYPKGTLDGADGVLEDGSPQFPGKVLGEWTCWGHFVGDGAKTTKGPWVVTNQLFRIGRSTIATVGYESPEVGAPIARAITGGTRRFAAARGEQSQRMLGFGTGDGVKLRMSLDVRSR
ncbi:MAG TPA: hypothetical protein VNO82_00790 [Solirubrobacteraceae bacterium]|nr:hypothetical protein [Solirubrobacteraceae bacterium]